MLKKDVDRPERRAHRRHQLRHAHAPELDDLTTTARDADHEITYDAQAEGASVQLDADYTSALNNDLDVNLCPTTTATFGPLNVRGTPGAANEQCPEYDLSSGYCTVDTIAAFTVSSGENYRLGASSTSPPSPTSRMASTPTRPSPWRWVTARSATPWTAQAGPGRRLCAVNHKDPSVDARPACCPRRTATTASRRASRPTGRHVGLLHRHLGAGQEGSAGGFDLNNTPTVTVASGIAAASVAQDLAFTEILSNRSTSPTTTSVSSRSSSTRPAATLSLSAVPSPTAAAATPSTAPRRPGRRLRYPRPDRLLRGHARPRRRLFVPGRLRPQQRRRLRTLACGAPIAGFDWSGGNTLQVRPLDAAGARRYRPGVWCHAAGEPLRHGRPAGHPRAQRSVRCDRRLPGDRAGLLPGVIANSSNPATVQYSATGHTDQTDGNDLNTLIVEIGKPVGGPQRRWRDAVAETIIGLQHASGETLRGGGATQRTRRRTTSAVTSSMSADRGSHAERGLSSSARPTRRTTRAATSTTRSSSKISSSPRAQRDRGVRLQQRRARHVGRWVGRSPTTAARGAYTQLGGGSSNTTSGGWQTVTIDVPRGHRAVRYVSPSTSTAATTRVRQRRRPGHPAAGGNWIFTEISEDATWTNTGIDQYTATSRRPARAHRPLRRAHLGRQRRDLHLLRHGGRQLRPRRSRCGSTARLRRHREQPVLRGDGRHQRRDPDPMAGFRHDVLRQRTPGSSVPTMARRPRDALSSSSASARSAADDANITWTALPLTVAAGVVRLRRRRGLPHVQQRQRQRIRDLRPHHG